MIHGDCLEKMKDIESGSVDLVLTDPPYGTTACKWDSIIPLAPMWEQLKRLIKPNGAIVMTASQPFTTTLISSNMEMFKYCWVWEKSRPTDFPNANNRPMKKHEDVLVYSCGTTANGSLNKMIYNPQGLIPCERKVSRTSRGFQGERPNQKSRYTSTKTNFPASILPVPSEGKTVHPTQKPIALMEYLIKTYTNEGETVLDFTMGSGTTGVACANTGRDFIGIEKEPTYFEIAAKRIIGAGGVFDEWGQP